MKYIFASLSPTTSVMFVMQNKNVLNNGNDLFIGLSAETKWINAKKLLELNFHPDKNQSDFKD